MYIIAKDNIFQIKNNSLLYILRSIKCQPWKGISKHRSGKVIVILTNDDILVLQYEIYIKAH